LALKNPASISGAYQTVSQTMHGPKLKNQVEISLDFNVHVYPINDPRLKAPICGNLLRTAIPAPFVSIGASERVTSPLV
jgi:hypothetical protein